MLGEHDTIAAPATASGGAIALIRVSGNDAFDICDRIFRGKTALSQTQANSVCYGRIVEGDRTIDDVLVTVFRAPRSYTGEDSVEISCHGSRYIVAEILRLLLHAGARMAQAGEFTTRAFLAGKMDLAQAEAVADLIASSSRISHALASTQMRGGFSAALGTLRAKLVQLTSLLELELDFSEEDVEFADRHELRRTMQEISNEIEALRHSFSLGNALKKGVAVAIIGEPNVGKSTLLNRLLSEERAMVSNIAGTTRDAIEETVDIDGILFRFIDTAGIRSTDDQLERMGIERSLAAADRARIVIHMTDATNTNTPAEALPGSPLPLETIENANTGALPKDTSAIHDCLRLRPDQYLIEVVNKIDSIGNRPSPNTPPDDSSYPPNALSNIPTPHTPIRISARENIGINTLRNALCSIVNPDTVYHGDAVVSSARHYEALSAAHDGLLRALTTLDEEQPADLLCEEIRTTLHHLGTITGEITTDEILGNIFSKFCIGK